MLFSPHRLADGATDVGVVAALPQMPGVVTAAANVAVTAAAAFMVTAQVPVPGQVMPLPDQPVKVPLVASAVRVTDAP